MIELLKTLTLHRRLSWLVRDPDTWNEMLHLYSARRYRGIEKIVVCPLTFSK